MSRKYTSKQKPETSSESEDISDLDDDEATQITKDAEKDYISNEFKDKVISYVKIDDIIRKKNEEVKELKEKKKEFEEFIIRYLDAHDKNFINLNGGKLVKSETESKGALKPEIIKDALSEGFTNERIVTDEQRSKEIIERIMDLMEKKRPVTKKVNLKRQFDKKKKN